jgi:hypothetical protein
MPPKKYHPAPVAEPQQEAKPASKGIAVNYAFNTNVPNYVFNPALWHPAKGRKPSVDALLCYMWCIHSWSDLLTQIPARGADRFGKHVESATFRAEQHAWINPC